MQLVLSPAAPVVRPLISSSLIDFPGSLHGGGSEGGSGGNVSINCNERQRQRNLCA
jgi:hypothetical protein